jgi:signal transduction histidine kinase/CheY-like chemotaxis protein/HPt (histidine-containing phosphotransfer) domain-containing protein
MFTNGPKPNDALIVRWLAIAGAGGAAVASAISYFSDNWLWQAMVMVTSLLAVAGIAGLWRAFFLRNQALADAAQQTGEQTREVSALQEELALHRRLERELTEAKQAAESAMMAKGEFLATMSHEIRTPLNGIIPMLDLLMSARLQPDHTEIVRTAYTSARQMQRIVDDILDYSKLEANKVQLETTSFNLRELLDSVIRLMEKPAESKGLRLTLQMDPAVRLAVRGDPVRLRQVLTNLLSNAVKFTERGSVSLNVTRRGESRTQHELRFEVSDTGIGIAKDARLFRAFSQADASTTRLYGGTGLGLVICKRIVDLMGGSIGVESEPGRGSTFWFEVPLTKAAGDIQGQRSDLNGARVLLLSTDATLRQRVGQAAPGWGATLTQAETTQDAIAKLRSALSRGSGWSFDLLLVDLNSVRSTAIALHRNLRRTPEFEDLRIAYLQGDEAIANELVQGSNALLLSRMIGNTELRSALSSFLSTPAASLPEEPEMPLPERVLATEDADAGPRPGRLRGRVLLVEDNPVNLMVAQRLVGLLGLQCETADNGEKAIQRLMSGNIDVVLMDCQMPVKDGYTASREWRQHEISNNLARLPIIAMTANAMAGDRQKCLDAGMDDYLSKPVDRRLLEATIARWLQNRPPVPESVVTATPTRTVATPQPAAPAPVARPPAPAMPPHPAERADVERPAAPAPVPRPAAPTEAAPMPRPATPSAPAPIPRPTPAGEPGPIQRPAPAGAPAPVQRPAPPVAPARHDADNLQPRPTVPFPPRPTAPAYGSPATGTPIPRPAPPAPAPEPYSTALRGDNPPTPPPVLATEVVDELRAVMGNEYISLVKLFLEDAPLHVRALETAATAGDMSRMVAPAHTLKSAAANLGAMALSAAAKRIELGARQGVLPRPAVAVAVLESEFRRASAALQALLKA